MATTGTVTGEELQARLAEEQAELEEAERAAGAAQLDGSGSKAAAKRLQDARTALALTEAAIGEHQRREREQAGRQTEAQATRRRERSYRWAARYFRAAAVVVQRMEALREAERELQALEIDGRLYDRKLNRDRLDDQGAGGFDMSLVDRIPFGRKGGFPARTVEDFRSIQRRLSESRRDPLTEQ